MPGNYPATLNYLKRLLANVTELTEAVDADLANPQFMADLAAFRDGERDELPPGRTLAVLDRLDGEAAGGQLKELAAMAAVECRKGPNELRIRSDGILFALQGALNSAWWGCRQMLRDTLANGKLSSIRDAVAYWSMIRYCAVIEDLAGPLRTNRRPRKATQNEAESMLLCLLRSYGETWRWDAHNDSVKTLREWKANRAKYRDDMTREQLDAWQREGMLIEGQAASHRVAGLEELAIPELLREVCPELIQCLPPTLPLSETIDAAERAIAYQNLEGLTRAELKKRRETADPPTAGKPATVTTAEPLTNREVNGATIPNEAEPVAGPFAKLQKSAQLAYWSYKAVETQSGRRLEDREAYEILTEDGLTTDRGDLRELAHYEPPAFDTWTRYLRDARKAMGESKYGKRTGRSHGKSIAKQDEI